MHLNNRGCHLNCAVAVWSQQDHCPVEISAGLSRLYAREGVCISQTPRHRKDCPFQTRVIGTVTPVLKGVTKRDTPKINITAEGFLSEGNYCLTIA